MERETIFGRQLVSSGELSSALQLVKHSIGNSATIAEHGCVKLKFGIDELEVFANDYRSKTRVVIMGKTLEGYASGEIWLGPVFINFIGLLEEQPIEILLIKKSSDIKENYSSYLKVITTESHYEFLSPIGWSELKDEGGAVGKTEVVCTLPTVELLEGLHFVLPALASDKDETVGVKASICLNVSKLKYIITTTDGLKISRYANKHESTEATNGEYLMDQKAVKLISAFLKRTRYEFVKIMVTDNSFIRISGEKEEIFIRLFSDKFPATENFFKEENNLEVVAEINAKHLTATLKRMQLMVDRMPKCLLEFDETGLKISNTAEVNTAEEHVELNAFKGTALGVNLNIKHLLECIPAMNCVEFVKFKMNAVKTYVILESDNEASKKCLFVKYNQ